jgi:adenylate kinase family enzyme
MDLAALDANPHPRRVAVIGCCGAGKSTLAAQLAPALGLPLVHLDREYWRPGWVEPDHAAWDARHAELIAAESWLLDGNYGRTMVARLQRADLVVLLHVSAPRALWRVLRRTWRDRGRTRPDMAPGCVERFSGTSNLDFYAYVARFNRRQLPRIRERLAEHAPGRVVVVDSSRTARQLIARAAALR